MPAGHMPTQSSSRVCEGWGANGMLVSGASIRCLLLLYVRVSLRLGLSMRYRTTDVGNSVRPDGYGCLNTRPSDLTDTAV